MKYLIILFVFACVESSAQNKKSIPNADIRDIEIFQSGAQVNRTVKTSVNAGTTELNFEGLSQYIDKNSVSCSAYGDVMILSVTHRLDYLNPAKKLSEQSKLEDSLDILKEHREKVNNIIVVYTEEQELLKANKSIGGANVGVSVLNLQKVADYFRSRMLELNSKIEDLQKEKKKIQERENKLNEQLRNLQVQKDAPTSTVVVTLTSKSPANVTLDLSYYVSGAGWIPQYDLRAKDTGSPIQLAYKANVYQSTGEKWDDVKLKLSTGNPSIGATKPTLNAWYLDFYRPVPQNTKGRYPAPAAQKELNEKGARAEEEQNYAGGITEMKAMSVSDVITVDENQLATEFDIAIPYSVPSDGKKHMVDVQSYTLTAAYNYYAAPKIDKDAFLVGRVTGWEQYNLLPGQANIYFEGSYVGESTIDPRSTNDTLDLSFGRDSRIVIKREKDKDLSKTRTLSGNTEKELHFTISVRNTKKEKINITIEDQLPISRNTDITVKTFDYSGGNLNPETGKVTWNFDVNPAATVEKKLSFSVKYPTGKQISGL
jgi:uncharacterized protein (TIGR02231 family)